MKVKDGRLVLPDGMSYRMLVLPQVETMTPQLLRKIKDLVAAGATVVGAPPVKSPSLSGYPQCDEEVKTLAAELWGDAGAGARPRDSTERRFGKGRVIWGGEFRPQPGRRRRAAGTAAAARNGSGARKAIPPPPRRRANATSAAS